eukprot:TRINITY_DN116751_c0_g1_i1.p1 TRINITY_DN116751_c0_g1~~TRINITY_DN116751_c0_g1_i1.p1  ORF type:complete len:211 (-),score=18.03 TRINITY_DN116751_c0_g1_i1:168-800(-)
MASVLRIAAAFINVGVVFAVDGTDHCVCSGPCPRYGKWQCHFANGTIDEKYEYGNRKGCEQNCHSDAQVLGVGKIPTPHDIICDFYNSTSMRDGLENAICRRVPAGPWNLGTKVCSSMITRVWNHDASDEHCPGFPEPWHPFKPIDDAMHKIWCWGLGKMKNEEPAIAAEVCNTTSRIKTAVCDGFVYIVWKHLEHDCNVTELEDSEIVV